LQLFKHPQHSEWFSTLSVVIFEVNILRNRNKHFGEEFFVFISLHFPQHIYWPTALPLLRLLPVLYLIPPINWASPQT